jgi:hypothetical protein
MNERIRSGHRVRGDRGGGWGKRRERREKTGDEIMAGG